MIRSRRGRCASASRAVLLARGERSASSDARAFAAARVALAYHTTTSPFVMLYVAGGQNAAAALR